VVRHLIAAVLEQKVVGLEARRAWGRMSYALGEPAPGPAPPGLTLPPAPERLAATPPWVFHRCGVERKRADTIRRAMARAPRVEGAAALPLEAAYRRLRALPGVGAWSAAEVGLVALGDADAVSLGDHHLPSQVSWALAGERTGTDERMLELLEPYRGHRGRVLRLLAVGGLFPPRRGPRTALRSIATI
jgi:3-methyladenine DNA glycosylase/8-oxoguanine DNA glycosylase